MRLSAFFAALALLTSFFATPAEAQQQMQASIRLISPVTATGDGSSIPAGLHVTINDGWKIYWRTPGEAGLPPVFHWEGSENLQSAEVQWPVPHRFTIFDIDNLGYKNSVTFPITLTPATAGGDVVLNLKLDLLVCIDICVPEEHHATLRIPAGAPAASPDAELHEAAIASLPGTVSETFAFNKAYLDYDQSNHQFLVVDVTTATAPGKDADLFVEHDSGTVFGKPVTTFNALKNQLTLRTPINTTESSDKLANTLRNGTLRLTYTHNGHDGIEGTIAVTARPDNAPVKGPALGDRIKTLDISIILMALLGGLILNLMPCVLPVLSLKILSVVSHGGKDNRKTIFKNFMASAAGIIFSFWLIAGMLLALKGLGSTIGWGIQFQHPGFLVFLIVILLAFSLNLWGLFEIPLPRFIARRVPKHEDEPTLAGHFLTGAFATLLATPCTAPFLGTAIGFALSRGAFEVFVIFTALGVGLALPYILLAVSPRIFRFMPKPGAWMVTLRKILAAALFLTAVWLGSILLTVTATPALDQGWSKFDAARIMPLVAEGNTVIVDVTADWCLTCKANKKFVLERDDIVTALSAENVVRMQADWTQRDEDIALYLQSFGRYGIPFNVVYGPAAPDGIVLPELLTRDAVINALAEAAGE